MADSQSRSPARSNELVFAGAAILVSVTAVGVLVFAMGARLDAPTVALAGACAALMYALRGLFSIVQALARPGAAAVLHSTSVEIRAQNELRDEKKRVLRAIKELDFDFRMGKLSKGDFEHIHGHYQARAVELMRALEVDGSLHPDLVAAVAEMKSEGTHEPEVVPSESAATGSPEAAAPEQAEPGAATDTDGEAAALSCASCGQDNDPDAKFCKQCGSGLAAGK